MSYILTTYIVSVVHPEYVLQVGLRRPVGHDVENDHELPEVDVAVAVGVVHPEDVLLKPLGIRPWVGLLQKYNVRKYTFSK